MTINICLATDENYLNYMATTIVSVLKSSNKEDKHHFYILCNNISSASKEYIKQLNKIKKFDITFLDVDIKDFEDFPAGGPHISNTTYFRYKIAELCPNVDKLIYMDCDVIVRKSLKELFDTDIKDYYLAGVEDVGYYYWRDFLPQFIWDDFYINAGILLINLDEWRKNNLFEKLMNFTINETENIAIGDQDVINRVCLGKIKPLDYKWNVQDSFYRKEREVAYNPNKNQIIEAASDPSIIHYTNVKKPWSDDSMPRVKDWRYYDSVRKGFLSELAFIFEKQILFIKKIPSFVFSVKTSEQGNHKKITILGIKIKIKK